MDVILFRAVAGLNTKSDPVRLAADENGVRDLARAVNVTVQPSGRIGRRQGAALLASGDFKSGWGNGRDIGFCVSNNIIYQINTDNSLTILTEILTEHLSFAPWGHRIYWTSGAEMGYVEGRENHAWEQSEYFGPDTDRVFTGPPLGQLLARFHDRMLIAVDDTIYPSEPFQPHLYWLENYVRFPGRIRLLAPVDDGVWVSDEERLYFVAGLDPDEQNVIEKTTYPAHAGAPATVMPGTLPYQELPQGRTYKIMTERGICLIGPAGLFINETQGKIDWETGKFTGQAAALHCHGDHLIASTAP